MVSIKTRSQLESLLFEPVFVAREYRQSGSHKEHSRKEADQGGGQSLKFFRLCLNCALAFFHAVSSGLSGLSTS